MPGWVGGLLLWFLLESHDAYLVPAEEEQQGPQD